MTRAGGVSTNTRSKQTETRGAKNRKGEFEQPARCRRGRRTFTGLEPTPQRDGPEAGRLRDGTARPANAEGTRIAKPHERWPIDLSAACAAGGKSTGPVDDGGPASAPASSPPRHRLAHFSEHVFSGSDRLATVSPKRARTLRRAPGERLTRTDAQVGKESARSVSPTEVAGKPIHRRLTVRPTVFRTRRTAGASRVGGRQRSSHLPTSAATL